MRPEKKMIFKIGDRVQPLYVTTKSVKKRLKNTNGTVMFQKFEGNKQFIDVKWDFDDLADIYGSINLKAEFFKKVG